MSGPTIGTISSRYHARLLTHWLSRRVVDAKPVRRGLAARAPGLLLQLREDLRAVVLRVVVEDGLAGRVVVEEGPVRDRLAHLDLRRDHDRLTGVEPADRALSALVLREEALPVTAALRGLQR